VPDSEGQAEYLLSGVWPSSATASSARSKVVEGSFTNSRPSVAAPGDGRTPPKTYQAGSLPYYRGGPGERLIAAVLGLAEDPNARVRFQLALTLGELESNTKLPSLVRLAQRDFADRWQTLALLSSLGPRPWPFLKRLVRREPGWLAAPTVEQAGFLDQVARLVGSDHTEAELGECLVLLTQPAPAPPAAGRLALLAGLADGLARSRQPLRDLISHPPITLKEQMPPLTALFDMAATNAASSREKMPNRLLAIRILALGKPESGGKTLLDLLRPEQPGEIQSAAARALAELDDGDLAKALFAGWNQYAAPTRRRVLATVPRSVAETESLASALEEGRLSPVELEASIRQSLLKTPNDQLKRRFQNLLKTFSAPDREEVVLRFQPALQLEGDRPRGAVIFAKTCSVCHTVEGRGQPVGPDLSGIASRPKEALLVDILDPSRQVSADFINYSLVTTGGKSVSGFILSETAASMTLRRSGEPDETVLRSQISELRAEGKSLMPEGLEQGLGQQDMADLLSFLQRPEGRLLGN
jgi:putative heme-binding domain-containing protein